MNIWKLCDGGNHIISLHAEPWRVVEAQHILSSRDLVDSSEEHDLLETMLEASKPPINTEKHYLIFTPFRYPPLAYGSRFGYTYEPSLWYGSVTLETAFAEVAYYRHRFFKDTEAELGYIEISVTAFSADLQTNFGIDLTERPFSQYTPHISDKNSYRSEE